MSNEVIPLLSGLSSNDVDNKSTSVKAKSSKKAVKRKISDSANNDNAKQQKLDGKGLYSLQSKSPKKKVIKPTRLPKTTIAFQDFIKSCLERRSNEESKNAVRKLEKLYKKLNTTMKTDSDEFKLYIKSCHDKITKAISKDIYTPMLDLYTEMKNRLQMEIDGSTSKTEGNNEDEELSEKDMKKIVILENKIAECKNKIKELTQQDINFDEDCNSAYIKEDRYQKKLIQLCMHLSKLTGNTDMRKSILKRKIGRKDIKDEMTGIVSVDEAILNIVNSQVQTINKLQYLDTQGCAKLLNMPEYLNVLECVENCNTQSNLGLSKDKMQKLACKAFRAIGHYMKKKRMNETKNHFDFLADSINEDPADKDVQLREKLEKNKKEGAKRLDEVFEKFTIKQSNLKKEDSKTDIENGNLNTNLSSKEKIEESIENSDKKNEDKENESCKEEKVILENEIVEKTILKSYTSENRIINEKPADCEKPAQVHDDTIVLSDCDSDNSTGVKHPQILQVDVKNSESVIGSVNSQTKVSYDVSTEKLNDASKVSKHQAWFIKDTIKLTEQNLSKPECIDLTEE